MIFNPPEELLKVIRFKDVRMELTLPTFNDVEKYGWVSMMFFAAVRDFFRVDATRRHIDPDILFVFSNPIINAAEHGNRWDEEKEIKVGLWFGEGGILFGIKDEGDFYTQQPVKVGVEARIPFSSTSTREREFGTPGDGMKHIYYKADHIIVDTEQGVLYLVLMTTSIIEED
ncbi:hypothetical protein HQ544_03335 [Candidatus Falkowbacteria bacterium]|nr:hypothetical protein [Candidatus Falkowbacteria bacterium]